MALLSLEDQIFALVEETEEFTVKEILALLPDSNYRAVYRAIERLETTQRIRVMRRGDQGRKVYTASGLTKLPFFKDANGRTFPLSALLPHMAELHDKEGHLLGLQKLDDILVLQMQLFVVAQGDDKAAIKRSIVNTHRQLIERRESLSRYIANIDALLRHPAMTGDVEEFLAVFGNPDDPEVPTPEELIKFRRWLSGN